MISAALEQRQALGQFLTPPGIANFMASLFERHPHEVKLLDPGAGTGVLSAALVQQLCRASVRPHGIAVTAYEVDSRLIPALEQTYADCESACLLAGISFSAEIFNSDFIESALQLFRADLFSVAQKPFNAAILNPPYRKIQSDSAARLLLRSAEIETSNLYTGFLALAARLLSDDAELVAITPPKFLQWPLFQIIPATVPLGDVPAAIAFVGFTLGGVSGRRCFAGECHSARGETGACLRIG